MAATHFSGPVVSPGGFTGPISGLITATSPLVVGSTSLTEAEMGVLDAVTPGTAAASKAVVLDSSKGIATITSATITTMTGNVVGNVTGNVTGNITGNVTGGTINKPDASQCTISGAAGAANVCTVTIQLKDVAGTNLSHVTPFTVYSSSAADGLTLASAASTGYSVASGGLSLNNGQAITTSIRCLSSATGGCVLSLTDTGKQAVYLVLVVGESIKVSTVLSSGSYG